MRVPHVTSDASLTEPSHAVKQGQWRDAARWNSPILCLFDLGRPEEKEYFEPTFRAKIMPQLIAPVHAYIAGP